MVSNLGGFFAVAAIVIVTPGPDTALTIRNSLRGGRGGGIATAGGVATGQALWALAACVGVAAVLQASHTAFTGVRLLGAAYLIYLGTCSVREAWRPARLVAGDQASAARAGLAYQQGVLSNVTNPKTAIFYASLLPQFIDSQGSAYAGMLLLGLLYSAMTLAWLTLYASVIAKVGDVLRRPRIRRALEALAGAALIGLGVTLASEGR